MVPAAPDVWQTESLKGGYEFRYRRDTDSGHVESTKLYLFNDLFLALTQLAAEFNIDEDLAVGTLVYQFGKFKQALSGGIIFRMNFGNGQLYGFRRSVQRNHK